MTIREWHHEFKLKLNKVDSQQNFNFQIPDIDFMLNEAILLIIKLIAEPRYKNHLGFEVTQRSIDDIKSIVKNDFLITSILNNVVTLPTDYMFYLRAYALVTKGKCVDKRCRVLIKQHDDMFEESSFDKSNFEWRFQNALFTKEGLKFYPDGEINKVYLSYIKKPEYVHAAGDFSNSGYKKLDGTVLTGYKNCELPDHLHSEIIDIAVLLASGIIQSPDYNIKQAKLNLNQII